MTKKRSNLQAVGRITGVFGIKGWVKVKSFTQPESNIVKYSPWWLKTQHGVKQVKITDKQFRPQGLVVHIEGVDDRDLAATFRNVDIAVELENFEELVDGDYYWHQLLGLRVVSLFEGQVSELGTVSSLLETGANDVLVVSPSDDSVDDTERLIPYVPETYVTSVDIEGKVLHVEWDPEF